MTARSVPEWIGKTPDTPTPARVKLRILAEQFDFCLCGAIFGARCKPEFDHIIALINGGENRQSNIEALCKSCHAIKTGADVAEKSKVARVRKKHLGIAKPKRPMPGSRASKWRKRMDGTVERRKP